MDNKLVQLKTNLLSFGLSTKETDVYIALLELGRETVTKISYKAGINRTTGYDILNSLVNKKLVSISGKEPKQEYVAEPPTAIIEYLKRQATQATENIKRAENIIPELNLLYTFENRPKIRFYEGVDGLKYAYEDTLSSSETILAYASVEDVNSGIPNYFPEYFKRRASKNIHIRAIFPETPLAHERSALDKDEKRESLLVPYDKYRFTPEINIYDNKVMIASWREKLGIIIESEEIADVMKKIYELAWSEAKRLDNKVNNPSEG
ncbi:MAG: helix-turn-helix domain-containing protein [Candidatus Paceibacterota bacterium]|jgi:sugar-specific transcriptional regulator TrmB